MDARQKDRALADACIAGSKLAWARLVEENRAHVRMAVARTAARYGADMDDDGIDDLESAVFLRLAVEEFRRLRLYRGDASLRSWLKVLAANATVDSLRKRRHNVPVGPGEELELTCGLPSPSEQLERAELSNRLRKLWDSLSPADARFVDMFFVQELSFEEIALETGSTPGALYARKNRIRKKLIELAAQDGWFRTEVA